MSLPADCMSAALDATGSWAGTSDAVGASNLVMVIVNEELDVPMAASS